MSLRVLPVVLVALTACDTATEDDFIPPEPTEGTCHARVDGATVDIVDVKDIGANARMDGSTLNLGCGVNTQYANGSSFETRLSFSIKAFDGVGEYTVDDTGTYGKGNYKGNDGNGYETFRPTDGPASSCTVSITEADETHVVGTFTCSDLHAYIDEPSGACCDSLWVDVTEGTFDLPFPEPEEYEY
jgi:hypothetical protein